MHGNHFFDMALNFWENGKLTGHSLASSIDSFSRELLRPALRRILESKFRDVNENFLD